MLEFAVGLIIGGLLVGMEFYKRISENESKFRQVSSELRKRGLYFNTETQKIEKWAGFTTVEFTSLEEK